MCARAHLRAMVRACACAGAGGARAGSEVGMYVVGSVVLLWCEVWRGEGNKTQGGG